MKKRGLITLWVGMILLMGLAYSSRAISGVNVNVGINVPPPPPLVISAPPPVMVIPRTYVYFAPEVEVDIFFYHDYWYRPYQGRWYRSGSYKGPWVHIVTEKVPAALLRLPPDFRHVPPGHQRISHGELKKNWKTWEKERYWDKHEHEEKGGHPQGKGRGKGKQGG